MNVYPLPPYQHVNLCFPFHHTKKQKTSKMPSSTRSWSWRLKKNHDVDAETRRNTHLNSLSTTTEISEKNLSSSEPFLRTASTNSSLRTSASAQSTASTAKNPLKLSETTTSSSSRKSGWLRRVFSTSSCSSPSSAPAPGDTEQGKRAYSTKKTKKDRRRKQLFDDDDADYDYEREREFVERKAWRQLSLGYAQTGVPWIP
ncbi:hypothetical protein BST61_g3185 [Cercospora zeina]